MAAAAARALATRLAAPFEIEPFVRENLDDRPFGDGKTMLVMAALYLVSLTLLKMIAAPGKTDGFALKILEQVNNLVMAVYSGYTFVGVAALLFANWADMGFDPLAPFCDGERKLLKGMDIWFYTFYLSKFWEWIDTWVLILKGKKVWPPSNSQYFLHVFHHTTTASIVWFAWRGEFSISWIGPLTNSFVHTPMYAYYMLSSVTPAIRHFGIYITPIQILQFILCLLSLVPETVGTIAGTGKCSTGTQRSLVWMWCTYSVFLCLFVKMFTEKKKNRKSKTNGAAKGTNGTKKVD